MSMSYCKSFIQETLNAVHDISADTFKIALYKSAAALDQNTTAYSATNELDNGAGYTSGGLTLTPVATYPKFESGGYGIRFQDVQWIFSSPKTDVRWALIYNSTKSNRGILSIDMGSTFSLFGTFNWRFPLTAPPIIYQKAPGIS